jgi:hypothetical protein
MATYNFDLLELADGESGEAAVSIVVGKKKTEAAAAKIADAADPVEPAAHGKPKYSYFAKLQHDNGAHRHRSRPPPRCPVPIILSRLN